MQQLFNFSVYSTHIDMFAGDWHAVADLAARLGFDGIELLIGAVPVPELPPGLVRGVHLPYWIRWLEIWRDGPAAAIPTDERQFLADGARDAAHMVELQRELWLRAAALRPRYAVFHVSQVTMEEAFTRDYAFSAEEVVSATIDLLAGDGAGAMAAPIPAHRGAEQFEALHAAAEQHALRTSARPAVFLATRGPVAQHKARADFATGFFETGGFAVIAGPGFVTVEEAAQAAHDSGAPIVVICATDERYPELVPPLVRLLKAERPDTTVVLAGYPADQVEAHKAAGVDEFIHVRADCHAILARLQQLKGVAA